jgi:hypothetical protein
MMYVSFLLFPNDLQNFLGRKHVLTLSSYDSFKIFMGLPTTGGGPTPKEQK